MKNKYPEEIKIYYSNWSGLYYIFIGFFTLFTAFYLFSNDSNLLGVSILILSIFLFYYGSDILFNNKPQMIINENGIQIINKKIIHWNRVGYMEIRKDGTKYILYYLDIHAKNRITEVLASIEVTNFNINSDKLLNLLIVYRDNKRKVLKNYEQ